MAGCGSDEGKQTDLARAEAAQRAAGIELYWVGRAFEDLPLTSVSHEGGVASFVYGTCKATSDSGCAAPLSIQVASVCDRNALLLDIRPRRRFAARGATVFDYADQLELDAKASHVTVFAASARARRAIAALRPLSAPGTPKRLAAPRYPRY